ncbi:phytanoyl-CoA dioxygenase family protein [candidate division KSB1 bacterium]|nr:phytanoyl-CoA dioxygenase family protein [candidate division KSB1 bacterium]NIR70092.1 phytanoyl-CoA dioxygenase family protein [candidate division KSB1 bacterium]NIS27517.1 phytanoyl-CoA dioxygenase family protein [candidate division KSB1 bacterium]NIT74368.1 phytanoyl-CoA dioxygenase family protein [candidate division KSB1 bacterium]NIU28235.1 phytanoyl-CoA dioxygenase family protein [candidate division KSB1 bacterium]
MTTANQHLDIDSRYPLTEEQIRFFREKGYIKLKNVLSPEVLEYYGKEITTQVLTLNEQDRPMSQRTTYEQAFIQITNLWQKSELIKEFVMGERLASIAAELMGVKGVRLYHDQALYKEPGGGLTPWHADQYYWPLASEKTCTVWIPLQETSLEMGPLSFAEKSQNFAFGRDLKISDESQARIQKALSEQGFKHVVEPFDLGEVSYHYGWTFHTAGPNTGTDLRKIMTMIYIDMHMRLKEPSNENQKIDWQVFCPGVNVGEIIGSPLNPILYSE